MGEADDRSEQERIRGRCFHPSGHFVEFTREAVEQSIPARFEDQARRHAGRVAVRTRDRTLTYAELNAEANRLAHAILARRGSSQEPVALLLPRGALLPVGIFGTLKAGKIFLSLDPVLPRARIAQILEDAGSELIVAAGEHTALAAELATRTVGWFDAGDLHGGLSSEDPGVAVSADSLSSLFYTSGSTGRPKGVVEDHRTTLFVTRVQTNVLPIGKVDRLALPAPPRERPPEAGHLVAPRTPIEERLERIWAEALGLPEVGVHDNFLELGGHSLVAARIVSRARVAFQLEAPVRALLEAPTIADMALLIVTDQAGRVEPERIDRMLADLDEPGA